MHPLLPDLFFVVLHPSLIAASQLPCCRCDLCLPSLRCVPSSTSLILARITWSAILSWCLHWSKSLVRATSQFVEALGMCLSTSQIRSARLVPRGLCGVQVRHPLADKKGQARQGKIHSVVDGSSHLSHKPLTDKHRRSLGRRAAVAKAAAMRPRGHVAEKGRGWPRGPAPDGRR